jgi:Lipase (class 3)/IPT/TIG domain
VISESSSIDLQILLGSPMTDPSGGQLLAFLRATTAQGPINVCLTGHSLGGQLANLLGLYLLENPTQWDSSQRSTVSCISFAAPTAGNGVFAKNGNQVYAAGFAAGTYPGWDSSLGSNLDNVACDMDGAPLIYASRHFFHDGDAGSLFSLYAAPNNPTDNIRFDFSFVPHAKANLEWSAFKSVVLQPLAAALSAQDYTQFQSQVFRGQFNGSGLKLPVSLADYIAAYAAQAGWQHSCSYPIYLGMPTLFDPRIVVRSSAPVPAKPVITKIDPAHGSRFWPTGHTVTITGSGFAPSTSANFILFSDPANRITYEITSATETEIQAVFHLFGLEDGTQTVSVVTSTPYHTSNAVSFEIT